MTLFTCSAHVHSAATVDERSKRKRRPLTIDFHCHVLTPECETIVADLAPAGVDPFVAAASKETVDHNRRAIQALMPKLTDPARRLRDMDATGIDMQVISVAPNQYYYWIDPVVGAELARMQNDRIATIVSENADRFVGLGTVPLQDVGLALIELDRIVSELRFPGVEVSSNVNGHDLDDPILEPFFARAEEVDALIFVHPYGFPNTDRLVDYYLNNVVGQPLDSTVAISRLILGGVLEAHPNLKICIAHGGGYLPFYLGRLEHAYHVRPECRQHITQPPSTYVKKLYVDTVVFTEASLLHLVEILGPDHIVLGTDYPYDMAEGDPVGFVARARGLSEDDRQAILGRNAARLLRLGCADGSG